MSRTKLKLAHPLFSYVCMPFLTSYNRFAMSEYTQDTLSGRANSNDFAPHLGNTEQNEGVDESEGQQSTLGSRTASRENSTWMDSVDSIIYFFHPSFELPLTEEGARLLSPSDKKRLDFVTSVLGTSITYAFHTEVSYVFSMLPTLTSPNAETLHAVIHHLGMATCFWLVRTGGAGTRNALYRVQHGITDEETSSRMNRASTRIEVLAAIGTRTAGPYVRDVLASVAR